MRFLERVTDPSTAAMFFDWQLKLSLGRACMMQYKAD